MRSIARGLPLFLLLLTAPALAASRSAEPSLDPVFDKREEPRPRPDASPQFEPDPGVVSPETELPAEAPEPIHRTADNERRRIIERLEPPERRPYVVVRSRAWLASGSVTTRWNVQLPPAQVTPPGLEVFIGETQDHKFSGLMTVNSAEIAPLSWLSLEFQYGADKPTGSYTDGLWVHAPKADILINTGNGATWHNPDHENDLVYGADESGYRDWIAATVYLRALDSKINSPESFDLRHTLDVGLGVERYRQNARRTNLAITQNLMKFYSNQPVGPIPGYDSTYDALWQGPHIALRDSISARRGLSLEGVVIWSPFMQYRGQDYENLNAGPGGLQSQTPNIQDSAGGTAIHFDIGAAWTFSVFRLEAGYQRFYFYSRSGKRRFYNFDGTVTERQLDFATTDLAGFYGGASLRF